MSTAQNVACTDTEFMDLAKPSTTLSGRLRFNRIVADAAYVYSLLAAAAGTYKDAARHARQCVTLNRRIWAAMESRVNVKKSAPLDETESDVEGASGASFDAMSSMRNDKGLPLVMSVTHDALNGADFWSLVPALYRALMQHSQVYAHQGLLHEAIYVAEQAEKVAHATKSPTLMTDNASWRADCWAQSGRVEKADSILDALKPAANRNCLSNVGYQSAVARVHHWRGQYEEEIASYRSLDKLLGDLTSPVYLNSLETFSPNVDTLAEQMSQLTVGAIHSGPTKAMPTTRGRKPAAKTTQRVQTKSVPRSRARAVPASGTKTAKLAINDSSADTPLEAASIIEQCSTLCAFQASIMHRGILANLLRNDIATASALLEKMDSFEGLFTQDLAHVWATFKTMLAQSFKQIAANFTVNTLPESTIAFPAIGLKERTSLEGPSAKRTVLAPSTTAKGGRGKTQVQEDFVETLRNARDRLAEAHASAATKGPNHMFQQVSMAMSNVTILLSAISGGELGGSLHPLYAAYMAGTYLLDIQSYS
jgi:separase